MYEQSQLEAVRRLAKLHRIEGTFTDEACVKFLDWYFDNKPKVNSELEAIAYGLTEGGAFMSARDRVLNSLVTR